jgi:hypothetical protein
VSVVYVAVECAQCGREAPLDPVQLRSWRHGELALADGLDEITAGMVLCPDCDREDLRDYDQGEAD